MNAPVQHATVAKRLGVHAWCIAGLTPEIRAHEAADSRQGPPTRRASSQPEDA